jgi:hypothetical protein
LGFSACNSCRRHPFARRRLRRMRQTLDWGICNSRLARYVEYESSWGKFLAHAQQSRPMVTAGLFALQLTGSRHSAGISCTTHELFCS